MIMFNQMKGIVRSFRVRQMEKEMRVLRYFLERDKGVLHGKSVATANAVARGCNLSVMTIDIPLGKLVSQELLMRSQELVPWAKPDTYDWFYAIANRAMVEDRIKKISGILGQETHKNLAEIPLTGDEYA